MPIHLTLKSLVSIKSPSKINAPTVIPPHVKMMSQVTDIMALLQAERNYKLNFQDRILEQVKQSIEAHAFSNGNLTHDFVLNLFQRHRANVNETLKQQNESLNAKIDNLLLVLRGQKNGASLTNNKNNERSQSSGMPMQNVRILHQWDGKFWHITKFFKFTKDLRRRRGW